MKKNINWNMKFPQTSKNYRVKNLLSWQKISKSLYISIDYRITKVYAPLLIQNHRDTSRQKLGVACDSAIMNAVDTITKTSIHSS